MPNWIPIQTAAERSGLTPQAVWKIAQELEKQGQAKKMIQGGKLIWQINEASDKRFYRVKPPELIDIDLRQLTQKERDLIDTRESIIKQWREFVTSQMSLHLTKSEATELFVKRYNSSRPQSEIQNPKSKISRPTLYRWEDSYNKEGARGLLPKYKAIESKIADEAIARFRSMYLDLRQPSVKLCYDNVSFESSRNGWGWFNSLRACQRWVQIAFPDKNPEVVLNRRGEYEYNAICAPYIERNSDEWKANECWYGDHHQFDLFVYHQGRILRPWLTAWQDVRTRMITGWTICESPNQDTIFYAFRDGCLGEFGPPAAVYVDNGKDFTSQALTGKTKSARQKERGKVKVDEIKARGLFVKMDVKPTFALPYNARAKGIERTFRTFGGQFDKTFTTYCGGNIQDRPDYIESMLKDAKEAIKAGRKPVDFPTLEELTETFKRYLNDVYHITPHQGEGMNDRPPLEVMRTELETKRVAKEDILELMMMLWDEQITVGKGGTVRCCGLLFGNGQPELLDLIGQKVLVSYDPKRLSSVMVWTLDYKLITRANAGMAAQGLPITKEDVRVGMRNNRRYKRSITMRDETRFMDGMDMTDHTIAAAHERLAAQAENIPNSADPSTYTPIITDLDAELAKRSRPLSKAVGDDTSAPDLPYSGLSGRDGPDPGNTDDINDRILQFGSLDDGT